MSAPMLTVTECPHCHRQFKVGHQHIGRTTRCPKCLGTFKIAPHNTLEAVSETDSGSVEYIGINCALCDTRYYGTQRHLGRPLPCPDCGTPNVLVRPKSRVPQRPAVLEGEQYELWEGDDQPWGTELVRQQAPLIRVTCKLCESITYVAPDRIGTTIVCTDCGQQLKVEATATIPEVETGLVASGEEYQLDEDSWSGSLEPSTVGPVYERLYQATPDERDRQISLVATDRRSRPKIPPQPLLTGYRSFLVGPGILARWFTLSLFSAIAAGLTQLAVSIAFSGLATIAALFFLLCAFVMAALMFGAASSCAIAILSESSEGNAHIHDWPTTNPADWLMDTVVILLALGGAGLPGGGLAYLFDAPPLVAITMSLLSVWLFFPVTLLSSLEGSSPFSLLMPGVTGSLFRFAPWWFQFYILSLLLITSIGGGLLVAGWFSTTAFIAGLPVAWIAWAVYFRMLGRLAWKIREG